MADTNGRLHWRYIRTWPSIPGSGVDCDWTVQNAPTSGPTTSHHVYTATGTSSSCPDQEDHVVIGSPSTNPPGIPLGKLTIYETATKPSAAEYGLHLTMKGDNETNTAAYNLERSGRMQLMANSSDGKQIRVLQEAHMEAGQYQYDWYTADLSAGIYYYLLRDPFARW